jgi:hypothetical protein
MKKIVLAAIIAVFSLSAFATGAEKDYVVTKDGVVYFNKVKYGADAYLVAKNSDGLKVKFSKEEILSYRKGGEVFQKKEMNANESSFYKLIKTRNGFSIMMNEEFNAQGELVTTLHVFKNDKYVLDITEDNVTQMLAFFQR